MVKKSMNRITEAFLVLWAELYNNSLLGEAATLCLLARQVADKSDDSMLRKESDEWLSAILEDLSKSRSLERTNKKSSDKICLFCNLSKPENELGAGAKGFICKSCVTQFFEHFKQ